MKTLQLTFAFICYFTLHASAQFHFGLSGGMLFSGLKGGEHTEEKDIISASFTRHESQRSFQFALPVGYQVNKHLSVIGEASYQRMVLSTVSLSAAPTPAISLNESNTIYSINYCYLSALMRLSTGGNKFSIFVQGGPSWGFRGNGSRLIVEKTVYSNNETYDHNRGKSLKSSELPFHSREFGYLLGGGIKVGLPYYDFIIDSRRYQSISPASPEQAHHISTWSLNATVLFTLPFKR